MFIGYMRISTYIDRQTTDLQKDALLKAGVDPRHLFEEHKSGMSDQRPSLTEAFTYMKEGDCLIVWKLDRLGRSLSHLLDIVESLKRDILILKALQKIQKILIQPHPKDLYFFIYLGHLPNMSVLLYVNALWLVSKLLVKEVVILQALEAGQSKASICRTFYLPRTTLYDYLSRYQKSKNLDK